MLSARLREVSYAPLRVVVRDPRSLVALLLHRKRSIPSSEVTLKRLALSPGTRIEFSPEEQAKIAERLFSSKEMPDTPSVASPREALLWAAQYEFPAYPARPDFTVAIAELDRLEQQLIGRKMQMHEYRQENEFMKRERIRLKARIRELEAKS